MLGISLQATVKMTCILILQVQFRLGQVINAESDCRDLMLKSLEEFASRGIPDLQSLAEQCSKVSSLVDFKSFYIFW